MKLYCFSFHIWIQNPPRINFCVWCEAEVKFNFFHLNIQWTQCHLLKRLSFPQMHGTSRFSGRIFFLEEEGSCQYRYRWGEGHFAEVRRRAGQSCCLALQLESGKPVHSGSCLSYTQPQRSPDPQGRMQNTEAGLCRETGGRKAENFLEMLPL